MSLDSGQGGICHGWSFTSRGDGGYSTNAPDSHRCALKLLRQSLSTVLLYQAQRGFKHRPAGHRYHHPRRS